MTEIAALLRRRLPSAGGIAGKPVRHDLPANENQAAESSL